MEKGKSQMVDLFAIVFALIKNFFLRRNQDES